MLSEKTRRLIEEYKQLMDAIVDKQSEIREAIETDTGNKLSLCGTARYPLHIYCSYGEAFDLVQNIADPGTLVETHKYDDGMANYSFTVNNTEAIAIGPQLYLEENRDGN